MESNKLIAEFMGVPQGEHTHFMVEPFALESYANVDDLKYDISWDWLMPVVEKIMWDNDIEDNQCTNIEEALCDAKIDRVYDSVVEFIKQYNNE